MYTMTLWPYPRHELPVDDIWILALAIRLNLVNHLCCFMYYSNAYKDVITQALELLVEFYEADENTDGWSYIGNRK